MAFHYSPNIITDGLVLYLDATNIKSYISGSTTWNDISRGGNNGTLTNGPTFNGGNGGSIVFDGVDDYADLGDSDTFTQPSGFTFDVFFKLNTTSNTTILEKYQTSGYEYVMGIFGGDLYAWVYDNTNSSYLGRVITVVSTYLPQNVWAQICFVYNGGITTSSVKIYINGIQRDNTNFNSIGFISIRNTPTPLTFGKSNPGLGSVIKGSLSSIKLYNRVLSQSEITQNYNTTKSRFGL